MKDRDHVVTMYLGMSCACPCKAGRHPEFVFHHPAGDKGKKKPAS